MEVKDLQPKQGNVEVTVEITDKGETREFQKFGKPGRVCTAMAKDASGEIKLSLWNEQIDQINVGDKIKIINGYVNEWQGEKQLTTGRMGKFEVVEKSEKQDKVYSNMPIPDKEDLGKLPEDPVNDEEYIG
jgi:replication factor A1